MKKRRAKFINSTLFFLFVFGIHSTCLAKHDAKIKNAHNSLKPGSQKDFVKQSHIPLVEKVKKEGTINTSTVKKTTITKIVRKKEPFPIRKTVKVSTKKVPKKSTPFKKEPHLSTTPHINKLNIGSSKEGNRRGLLISKTPKLLKYRSIADSNRVVEKPLPTSSTKNGLISPEILVAKFRAKHRALAALTVPVGVADNTSAQKLLQNHTKPASAERLDHQRTVSGANSHISDLKQIEQGRHTLQGPETAGGNHGGLLDPSKIPGGMGETGKGVRWQTVTYEGNARDGYRVNEDGFERDYTSPRYTDTHESYTQRTGDDISEDEFNHRMDIVDTIVLLHDSSHSDGEDYSGGFISTEDGEDIADHYTEPSGDLVESPEILDEGGPTHQEDTIFLEETVVEYNPEEQGDALDWNNPDDWPDWDGDGSDDDGDGSGDDGSGTSGGGNDEDGDNNDSDSGDNENDSDDETSDEEGEVMDFSDEDESDESTGEDAGEAGQPTGGDRGQGGVSMNLPDLLAIDTATGRRKKERNNGGEGGHIVGPTVNPGSPEFVTPEAPDLSGGEGVQLELGIGAQYPLIRSTGPGIGPVYQPGSDYDDNEAPFLGMYRGSVLKMPSGFTPDDPRADDILGE